MITFLYFSNIYLRVYSVGHFLFTYVFLPPIQVTRHWLVCCVNILVLIPFTYWKLYEKVCKHVLQTCTQCTQCTQRCVAFEKKQLIQEGAVFVMLVEKCVEVIYFIVLPHLFTKNCEF